MKESGSGRGGSKPSAPDDKPDAPAKPPSMSGAGAGEIPQPPGPRDPAIDLDTTLEEGSEDEDVDLDTTLEEGSEDEDVDLDTTLEEGDRRRRDGRGGGSSGA